MTDEIREAREKGRERGYLVGDWVYEVRACWPAAAAQRRSFWAVREYLLEGRIGQVGDYCVDWQGWRGLLGLTKENR